MEIEVLFVCLYVQNICCSSTLEKRILKECFFRHGEAQERSRALYRARS